MLVDTSSLIWYSHAVNKLLRTPASSPLLLLSSKLSSSHQEIYNSQVHYYTNCIVSSKTRPSNICLSSVFPIVAIPSPIKVMLLPLKSSNIKPCGFPISIGNIVRLLLPSHNCCIFTNCNTSCVSSSSLLDQRSKCFRLTSCPIPFGVARFSLSKSRIVVVSTSHEVCIGIASVHLVCESIKRSCDKSCTVPRGYCSILSIAVMP